MSRFRSLNSFIESLKALASKKNTITSALLILAIVAIWYAWKISTFSSLSESDAKWWLRASEVTLLASTVLLTVGLFGEWPESESWKERFLYRAAKACVILGVTGELIGDAGIFQAGDRVQELDGKTIASLNLQSAQLAKENAQAQLEIARANARTACVEQAVAWRVFTVDFEKLRSELSKLKGHTMLLWYVGSDPEVAAMAAELIAIIGQSGWYATVDVATFAGPMQGIFVGSFPPAPPNQENDDEKFVSAAFTAAHISHAPASLSLSTTSRQTVASNVTQSSPPPTVKIFVGTKGAPTVGSCVIVPPP